MFRSVLVYFTFKIIFFRIFTKVDDSILETYSKHFCVKDYNSVFLQFSISSLSFFVFGKNVILNDSIWYCLPDVVISKPYSLLKKRSIVPFSRIYEHILKYVFFNYLHFCETIKIISRLQLFLSKTLNKIFTLIGFYKFILVTFVNTNIVIKLINIFLLIFTVSYF